MAFYLEDRGSKPESCGEPVTPGRVTAPSSLGGIRPVTKVRHLLISGDRNLGYVNSDLIFLAGIPILVLVWEERPFGDYPAVTVNLDPSCLHQVNSPVAEYLYECSIEDPRGAPLESGVASNGQQAVEQLSDPIPSDLREVFLETIRLYDDWKFGGPEPLLSFRKLRQISISGVCELVLSYRNEPLPANLHHMLRNLIGETRAKLEPELAEDPSYATGAKCLLKLIDEHKRQAAA
jgi:hypothetical protein